MSPLGKFTLALLGLRIFGASGFFWGLFLGHILIDRTKVIKNLEKQLSIVDDNIRLFLPYKYYRYYNVIDGNFWGKLWGTILGSILFGFHGFIICFIIGHFTFDTPNSRHAKAFRLALDNFFNTHLGKILGAIIGFSLHSPILLFCGIIIGFFADLYRSEKQFRPLFGFLNKFWFKINPFKFLIDIHTAKSNSLVQSMAGLAAKVAKADGRVSENEIRVFKKLFNLQDITDHRISKTFNKAKESIEGWEPYALQILRLSKDDLELKEGVIENLFKIATADGQFGAEELKLIKEIAKTIELPEGNFDVIRQAYEPKIANDSTVADFYDVLGVLRTATDAEIKAKWKKLINIYHPDRIQAKGATAEEVEKATLKMAEINNAYQNIMKSRKVA